jgi:hypothetical protein
MNSTASHVFHLKPATTCPASSLANLRRRWQRHVRPVLEEVVQARARGHGLEHVAHALGGEGAVRAARQPGDGGGVGEQRRRRAHTMTLRRGGEASGAARSRAA